MKLINLDENVLQALDFFIAHQPPRLNLDQFKLPFVVGSGNAFNTGKIIFSGRSAIFADESEFKSQIKSFLPAIKKKLITQEIGKISNQKLKEVKQKIKELYEL